MIINTKKNEANKALLMCATNYIQQLDAALLRRCDENTIIPDNPYLGERGSLLEIAGGQELR